MADEGAEEGEEVPKKKLSGKRIVLFILIPLLLLLGILAGLYFAGVFDALLGGGDAEQSEEEQQEEQTPPIEQTGEAQFHEMEDILVALGGEDGSQNYLKLKIALQVNNEAALQEMERIEPRVNDEFQAYLRELRLQDLRGSEGLYRLREELLRRVNLAAEEARVRDVLIREMLVQ